MPDNTFEPTAEEMSRTNRLLVACGNLTRCFVP